MSDPSGPNKCHGDVIYIGRGNKGLRFQTRSSACESHKARVSGFHSRCFLQGAIHSALFEMLCVTCFCTGPLHSQVPVKGRRRESWGRERLHGRELDSELAVAVRDVGSLGNRTFYLERARKKSIRERLFLEHGYSCSEILTVYSPKAFV